MLLSQAQHTGKPQTTAVLKGEPGPQETRIPRTSAKAQQGRVGIGGEDRVVSSRPCPDQT